VSGSPRCCASGSTTGATCCCAARTSARQIDRPLEVLGGYLSLSQPRQVIRSSATRTSRSRPDEDLQAQRRPGRPILNMRLRQSAQLEEDGDQGRGQDLRTGAGAAGADALREGSMGRSPTRSRRCARRSAPKTPSASAAPISPRRPRTTRPGRGGDGDPQADHRVVSEKGLDPRVRAPSPIFRASCQADDALKFASRPRPRPKCVIFATNGRFYTLDAPSCRAGAAMASRAPVHRPRAGGRSRLGLPLCGGRKFLVASRQGKGFVVAEDECLANTRKASRCST